MRYLFILFFILMGCNAGAQDTTHYPKDTIIVNKRADGRLFLSDDFLHIYPYDTLPRYNIAKVLVLVTDTAKIEVPFDAIMFPQTPLQANGNLQKIGAISFPYAYPLTCWELFKNSQSLGYFMDEKCTLPLNPNYVIWQTIVINYKKYTK